ncbi:MAG: hypothetical protein FK730_14340 [Asgard group archaeon]|nr:hypothetical protein [Asgard group archaeon]
MEIEQISTTDAKYLLVGCEAIKERDGMSELWHVLVKYCQIIPLEVFELPIRGLFLFAFTQDLNEISHKLRTAIIEKKFKFKICKRFTPLEKIMKSSLNEMVKILPNYLKKIPSEAKWRITIHRRHTTIERQEIIASIANHPNAPKGKVDLDNAEWDIIIEIFGEWLGLGVFPSKSIVTVKNKNN